MSLGMTVVAGGGGELLWVHSYVTWPPSFAGWWRSCSCGMWQWHATNGKTLNCRLFHIPLFCIDTLFLSLSFRNLYQFFCPVQLNHLLLPSYYNGAGCTFCLVFGHHMLILVVTEQWSQLWQTQAENPDVSQAWLSFKDCHTGNCQLSGI